MSTVRNYTTDQVLTRALATPVYQQSTPASIPAGFWIMAVRAKDQRVNRFNDKFYLFRNRSFVRVFVGTTLSGVPGLRYPSRPTGTAVLASNYWYVNAWRRALHRGRVLAYTQRLPLPVYRDNDRDDFAEEIGKPDVGLFGINIHPASYVKGSSVDRIMIGEWSRGCLVFRNRAEYDTFMDMTKDQNLLSTCLVSEWEA